MTLWDVSDPANPDSLALIRASQFGGGEATPHNPLVTGDFLYVSWYDIGLQVFDISDPANPVHVGGYDTSSAGLGNWGVYPFLGTDRVLLSDIETGLYIVDVSAVVPEPATSVLSCFGFAALALFLKKKGTGTG